MADLPKGFDVEQLFSWFYNGGNRRTLQATTDFANEQGVEVANITVRRYADEFDWQGRADNLDDEARKVADRRVANLVGRHRARQVEAIATLQTKFFRRLVPSTRENPNPAEILPGDIDIDDFIALGKAFELLTGGATSRVGMEGPTALEDMARAIAEMDNEDRPALLAGETG